MLVTPEEAGKIQCCTDATMYCVGPKCMGWRWKSSLTRWADGPRQREEVMKTHGVCGLAGDTL